MQTQLTTYIITKAAAQAGIAATLIVSLLSAGFFVLEPKIGHGAESIDFEIRQTITDETSFTVDPSDVTMSGSIAGLSGGTATGTTGFVVRSNNASGYSVTIDFYDNTGAYAMQGDDDDSQSIRDYALGAGTPTYNMTASTAAQFAYSVHSSTSADSAAPFWTNGTTCASGSGSSAGKCWKLPSTTATEVIDRTTAAASGATSTLYFKVHVPSTPSPALTAQVYTATATLSVVTQ